MSHVPGVLPAAAHNYILRQGRVQPSPLMINVQLFGLYNTAIHLEDWDGETGRGTSDTYPEWMRSLSAT